MQRNCHSLPQAPPPSFSSLFYIYIYIFHRNILPSFSFSSSPFFLSPGGAELDLQPPTIPAMTPIPPSTALHKLSLDELLVVIDGRV
jgi:hypothetical protein